MLLVKRNSLNHPYGVVRVAAIVDILLGEREHLKIDIAGARAVRWEALRAEVHRGIFRLEDLGKFLIDVLILPSARLPKLPQHLLRHRKTEFLVVDEGKFILSLLSYLLIRWVG